MKSILFFAALAMSAVSFGQIGETTNDMYGGRSYVGEPNVVATASLIAAGGGVQNFSVITALNQMVGQDAASAEMANLVRKYGQSRVDRFILVFNFAVKDSVEKDAEAGIKLPTTGLLTGKDLAEALVKSGMDDSGVFWTGHLLDETVSHGVYSHVLTDIDQTFGTEADQDYHRISDQAHYDLGKDLGVNGVLLASLH